MNRKKGAIHCTAATIIASLFACSAFAEWEVINLHPAGCEYSEAYGISGGQQVGYVSIGGVRHASLWNGTAESWVDLHPAGFDRSEAYDISSGQQVGAVWIGGVRHACLWSGTADSWVDLHPAGYSESYALSISGGQQAGTVNTAGVSHASLWSGTADSFVDLHPTGYTGSSAYGISGGQQVGSVGVAGVSHAGLWSGSADSFVDLHPGGFVDASIAHDISDGQQVGEARDGWVPHAVLWSGTAGSWVDLFPAGYEYHSGAYGVSSGYQVGYVMYEDWHGNQDARASLWSGTAESWVDLQGLLPTGYIQSYATGIEVTGTDIWIAGGARNYTAARFEAFLWHYIIPAPSAVSRRSHEAAGTFDMAIPPEGVLVDPRQNGASPAMVLTYEMAPADPGCAGVTVVNGTCNGTSVSGNDLVIDMTYDGNTCVEVTVGNHTFRVLTHEGDVNADGDVNVIDLQMVRSHVFQSVDSARCRCDVNCDGAINVLDLQETKNNIFTTASCD